MAQAVSLGQLSSASPASQKLSTPKIFDYISQRICLVTTGKRPSTGVLLENKYLLVANQVLSVSGQIYSRERLPRVEFVYREIKYTAEYALHSQFYNHQNGSRQRVSDLCLCRILDSDFPDQPSCSILTEDPQPGEKVYFAGYSSEQRNLGVHKGLISWVDDSVRENRHEQANFKIDGTLLPGYSGGPVFILRQGELVLAGLMRSDIDVDFIKEHKELEPILSMSVNSASLDTVVSTVVKTVFNNISRGHGSVIHAKHVAMLLKSSKTQLSSNDPLFLEWYHGFVEATQLSKQILSTPIFGTFVGQKIKPEEEQKLWAYYQQNVSSNPQHEFQVQLVRKTQEDFSKLKEKITHAVPERDSDYLPLPRTLRLNREHWLKLLESFSKTLPSKTEEIKVLVHLIIKPRVPDTRVIAYC